jgi:hypothetical protein
VETSGISARLARGVVGRDVGADLVADHDRLASVSAGIRERLLDQERLRLADDNRHGTRNRRPDGCRHQPSTTISGSAAVRR